MEVHHHSHTKRQSWKHYFWEFFMLFLAVTAGFLVENQREHYIEHKRAKVFATNLYEELKSDTVDLSEKMREITIMAAKLDTFCLLSSGQLDIKPTTGMLYYYSSYTTSISFFASNNTTIDELKGSGSLRIMSNDIVGKIGRYSKQLSAMENEYSLTRAEFARIEELYFKIFDGNTMAMLAVISRDSILKMNPTLVNDDPKLMKEFAGWLKFEKGIYDSHNREYHRKIIEQAGDLITSLKKEYDL